MIRASALYFSVLMSLLIVLVCGSLLMACYLFRMQNKRSERLSRLNNNLQSGISIVTGNDFPVDTTMLLPLFEETNDSVRLEKRSWGVYEFGSVSTWEQQDTLTRRFLMARVPGDSLTVLYISDEDRPVSISGKSLIRGEAHLPKAGIRAAYVNGNPYAEKTLVYGATKDSGRDVPELDASVISRLQTLLLDPDSLVTLDGDFKEKHAVIVARTVHIPDDFRGQLQVIATDSIIVGDGVKLEYPSALVLIKNDTAGFQRQLKIGADTEISGQLISWEQVRSTLMPVVSIGDRSIVKGAIWSKGYINFGKQVRVDGAAYAIRLMARVSGALYENYLIDVELNIKERSQYYLEPALLNKQTTHSKILCWLN